MKTIDEIEVGDQLAMDVHAASDLPPFRVSVMDGYAINTIENYDELPYQVQDNMRCFAGMAPLSS